MYPDIFNFLSFLAYRYCNWI